MLESVVIETTKRIDKHLMHDIYDQYKFKEHRFAIKHYFLLMQEDFVRYLLDVVGL